MIDMTFQLIAFFMLIINFSEVEKGEEINLPLSELAKPPEEQPPYKITLNLKDDGSVSHFDDVVASIDVLRPILNREIGRASREGVAVGKVNVIIRADLDVETGEVQRLMNKCRDLELETFSLRVIERIR